MNERSKLLQVDNAHSSTRRVIYCVTFTIFLLALCTPFYPNKTSDVINRFSTSNISCPFRSYHETGYIKLTNKNDDYYFYWYSESRNDPKIAPLVLWLSGGPGFSSMVALFLENGPCTLENNTLRHNPFAWNNAANVIWLDQPTNVGFSYSNDIINDVDHNETVVGESIYYFLQGFMEKHPELRHRSFFITGESYGGHYIPAVTHYILTQQSIGLYKTLPLNLEGISIGNGYIDTITHTQHIFDIVENDYNVTLLHKTQLIQAEKAQKECIKQIRTCLKNPTLLFQTRRYCAVHVLSVLTHSGRNMYDLRLPSKGVNSTANAYADFSSLTAFLNGPETRQFINVTYTQTPEWKYSDPQVASDFAASLQFFQSAMESITELLNQTTVRVLLYAGDTDLVCNWNVVQAVAMKLQWYGQRDFQKAPSYPLRLSSSKEVGRVRSFDRLTLIRVFNAGHMVPADQPEVASTILNRFLRNESCVENVV
uniref:Carboxypeptidase n=1 Tax=Albugo laibachii Nc14 TaxID=890382 RepID=F0W0A8_9STRA|nr:serine protease family S10 putative [Albugo laibachii Nc14]|eukprot:CCA14479.1 serine protease family S10 putative [Albugo laibachii Nc14]